MNIGFLKMCGISPRITQSNGRRNRREKKDNKISHSKCLKLKSSQISDWKCKCIIFIVIVIWGMYSPSGRRWIPRVMPTSVGVRVVLAIHPCRFRGPGALLPRAQWYPVRHLQYVTFGPSPLLIESKSSNFISEWLWLRKGVRNR